IADESFCMNAIRRVVGIDIAAQINSLLAVRGKAHYFPLVAVWNKTKKSGELGVEKSEGIGPIDSENVIEAACAPVPYRGRFPSASAGHDDNGGGVKSGIGIGANGVCEMVIDKAKLSFVCAEGAAVGRSAGFLMPHAEKVTRGIQKIHVRKRPVPGRIEF